MTFPTASWGRVTNGRVLTESELPRSGTLIARRKELSPGDSPPGCSGDHAIDDDVDGEAEPLVAIASHHLRCVGRHQRALVGR